MENNKNKKSVKFQGDMLKFCDFIQVSVYTRNHHLKVTNFRVTFLVEYTYIDKLPRKVNNHSTSHFKTRKDANNNNNNNNNNNKIINNRKKSIVPYFFLSLDLFFMLVFVFVCECVCVCFRRNFI